MSREYHRCASGYILKDADEAIAIDAIRAIAAGRGYLQPRIQLAVAGAVALAIRSELL